MTSTSGGTSRSGKRRSNPTSNSNSNSNPASSPTKNPRTSSPFADFGSYMAAKNRKLSEQFDADASSSSSAAAVGAGGIFCGVSIFVDGFTVPSSQELKEIMLKNGGRFVNYFSRQTVTHIVCSHLPDSKMRNLRAFSRGIPVVKPTWVVDSVVANQLLNWAPYQISEHGTAASKQLRLSAFFSQKSTPNCNQKESVDQSGNFENSCSSSHESQDQSGSSENEGSLCNEEIPKDLLSSGGCKFSTCEGNCNEEFSIPEHGIPCESKGAESSGTDEPPDVNSRRSNLCSTSYMHNHFSREPLEQKGAKSSNRPHSTLTDPNFVENYFKYSRLHFIGTWRNRYRKRFSSLLNGARSSKVKDDRSNKQKTIIHIDMDCFFVSVIIRNFPELIDKPVAVCHSDNPKGTAEISSANYPARNYGIKAGMFVRDAKARCPYLVIVPYNFEAYEEVADQFYAILHKHCNKVQALSCDEAFLDMTECSQDDPEQIATLIRKDIAETTRCTASAGIAENLLLARLATKSAKPNGQCFIPSEKVDEYLNNLPIKALPGIGYTVAAKLKTREVESCSQLRMISKEALHKDFGKKTGDMLWNYCRGIDHSVVEAVQETKSVGAEVNWGVRFNASNDVENFLMNLCKEVSLRLQGCGVQGRTITLKVKTKRKGADEPTKFLGCGDCETISRSMTIAGATDNAITLQQIAKQIFAAFNVDVKEVRGVGLKMSRLEHVDMTRKGPEGNVLESWLSSPPEKFKKQPMEKICSIKHSNVGDSGYREDGGNSRPSASGEGSHPSEVNPLNSWSSGDYASELPPLCRLDIEVLNNLPSEIISEMNDIYKGELHVFLEMHRDDKGRKNTSKFPTVLPEHSCEGVGSISNAKGKGKHSIYCQIPQMVVQTPPSKAVSAEENVSGPMEHEEQSIRIQCKCTTSEEIEKALDKPPTEVQAAYISCTRSDQLIKESMNILKKTDLMPGSLSQADVSVLQQLPEDVRADISNALPLHRVVNPVTDSSDDFASRFPNAGGKKNSEYSRTSLFSGALPKWVEHFRVSSCFILNVIGESYTKFSPNGLLSSVLESIASFLPLCPKSISEEWNAALSCFSDLLTQYIQLKVESDIEELHKCFCLLKRFSSASEFFLEAHNTMLPFLQASVNEHYGGILHFQ